MPTVPAAWYPDPHEPARKRYWDGAQWTGYLVDPDRPDVVRYEHPPWLAPETAPASKPGRPGGINVPMSVALTMGV